MARNAPLPAYNYIVQIQHYGRDPNAPLGGFSDVSGLETDIHISEYRDGNEAEPHVRKIPGSHKVGDVTLKRGVVDSSDLWEWITDTRTTGVAAQRMSSSPCRTKPVKRCSSGSCATWCQ